MDFEARLSDLGGSLFLNNLILGILVGLLDCDTETARSMIRSRFILKGEAIVEKNLAAFDRGLDVSKQISLPISIQKDSTLSSRIVLSGTEAVGIGVIAGGCNFIASYPMSRLPAPACSPIWPGDPRSATSWWSRPKMKSRPSI